MNASAIVCHVALAFNSRRFFIMTDYTSILGRKYKTTIQNIYPFVFYLRDNKSMRDCFILNMNDTVLPKYYGKKLPQKTFYRYVETLEKLGLIECVNETYYYNKGNGYCKSYILNPFEISRFLINNEYNGIDPLLSVSSDNIDIQDVTTFPQLLLTQDYYNMLVVTFENKKNEIVKRLNERDIVRFRCGLVTRYDGGRATSSFCGLPTLEKEHSILFKWYREDYLDDMFGKKNWEEYDVPSSVPQVFHLLNKGFWLGKRVYDMTPNPAKYKEYAMRLMFNKTDKQVARAIMKYESDKLNDKKSKFYSKKVNEDLAAKAHILKSGLEDIIGPTTIGKDIFIHESNIYLLVCEELMNRNIDFAQCYDGFYFRKGERPADMAELVKSKAEEYYNKYYIGE